MLTRSQDLHPDLAVILYQLFSECQDSAQLKAKVKDNQTGITAFRLFLLSRRESGL